MLKVKVEPVEPAFYSKVSVGDGSLAIPGYRVFCQDEGEKDHPNNSARDMNPECSSVNSDASSGMKEVYLDGTQLDDHPEPCNLKQVCEGEEHSLHNAGREYVENDVMVNNVVEERIIENRLEAVSEQQELPDAIHVSYIESTPNEELVIEEGADLMVHSIHDIAPDMILDDDRAYLGNPDSSVLHEEGSISVSKRLVKGIQPKKGTRKMEARVVTRVIDGQSVKMTEEDALVLQYITESDISDAVPVRCKNLHNRILNKIPEGGTKHHPLKKKTIRKHSLTKHHEDFEGSTELVQKKFKYDSPQGSEVTLSDEEEIDSESGTTIQKKHPTLSSLLWTQPLLGSSQTGSSVLPQPRIEQAKERVAEKHFQTSLETQALELTVDESQCIEESSEQSRNSVTSVPNSPGASDVDQNIILRDTNTSSPPINTLECENSNINSAQLHKILPMSNDMENTEEVGENSHFVDLATDVEDDHEVQIISRPVSEDVTENTSEDPIELKEASVVQRKKSNEKAQGNESHKSPLLSYQLQLGATRAQSDYVTKGTLLPLHVIPQREAVPEVNNSSSHEISHLEKPEVPLRRILPKENETVLDLQVSPIQKKYQLMRSSLQNSSSNNPETLADKYMKEWRPTGRFQCKLCFYSCVTHNFLFRHWVLNHCSLRPYMCGHCGFQSATRDGVTRHQTSKHRGLPRRIFIDNEQQELLWNKFDEMFNSQGLIPEHTEQQNPVPFIVTKNVEVCPGQESKTLYIKSVSDTTKHTGTILKVPQRERIYKVKETHPEISVCLDLKVKPKSDVAGLASISPNTQSNSPSCPLTSNDHQDTFSSIAGNKHEMSNSSIVTTPGNQQILSTSTDANNITDEMQLVRNQYIVQQKDLDDSPIEQVESEHPQNAKKYETSAVKTTDMPNTEVEHETMKKALADLKAKYLKDTSKVSTEVTNKEEENESAKTLYCLMQSKIEESFGRVEKLQGANAGGGGSESLQADSPPLNTSPNDKC